MISIAAIITAAMFVAMALVAIAMIPRVPIAPLIALVTVIGRNHAAG